MSLIDNLITRFDNGLTNVPVGNIFASLPQPDTTRLHTVEDDFTRFVVGEWSVGGVGTPTRALVAGQNGILQLGNSAADNDNSWIQQALPTYLLTAGKKTFFRARVSLADVVESDMSVGLQIAVAANDFLTPANGIFFRKSDGAATVVLVNRAATVETVTSTVATMVAATQINFSFYYDGAGSFWAGVNGVPVARLTPAAVPAVLMGVVAGVQNGEAAGKTMNVDALFAAQER